MEIILRGGPRCDQSITACEPLPDVLRVPPSPTLFIASFLGFPEIPESPEPLLYHRAAVSDDPVLPTEYYFDREVAVVAQYFPLARNWKRVGENRFTGRRAGNQSLPHSKYFVVRAPDGRLFSLMASVEMENTSHKNFNFEEFMWEKVKARMEYELTPECEAPDCTEKGTAKLIAKEHGWFAGKIRDLDDEIHLCRRHLLDVFRVIPGGDPDLPDWLEADAYHPVFAGGDSIILSMLDEEQKIVLGGFHPTPWSAS